MWIVTGVGAVALLLSNLTSILTDARRLPAEVTKTSDQFFEWYGAYDEWKGRWTYFPEGDIETEALKLTDEPFQLVLDVTNKGEVTGSIETRGICEAVPYFDALMVSGEIHSKSRGKVVIFDYVAGYRKNFAELKLVRDGGTMTVRPTVDPLGAFQKESRIALAPEGLNDPAEFDPICPNKRQEFMRKALGPARDTGGKRIPVEQFVTDRK